MELPAQTGINGTVTRFDDMNAMHQVQSRDIHIVVRIFPNCITGVGTKGRALLTELCRVGPVSTLSPPLRTHLFSTFARGVRLRGTNAVRLITAPTFPFPSTENSFSWWDETRDAGNFMASPLLDLDTGFGGNGTGPDGCVTDGPFANTTLHIGPGYLNQDHCLSRKVNEFNSTLANKTYVQRCHEKPT